MEAYRGSWLGVGLSGGLGMARNHPGVTERRFWRQKGSCQIYRDPEKAKPSVLLLRLIVFFVFISKNNQTTH